MYYHLILLYYFHYRIKTFFVDQTNPVIIKNLFKEMRVIFEDLREDSLGGRYSKGKGRELEENCVCDRVKEEVGFIRMEVVC